MNQKLKKVMPFLFMAVILLNTLFSQQLLLGFMGELYTYLYIPLFWLALAAVSYLMLRKKHYRKSTVKDVIFWVCTAAILYLIIRITSGLIEGFGYNSHRMAFLSICRNLFAYVVPYLAREVVRAAILKDCRPGKPRTKVICVLSCVVLAFSELNFVRLMRDITEPLGAFEQLGGNLMPAIVASAMLTYAALNAGFIPGIIYRAIVLTPFYLLPIVPDSTWLTTALLGSLVPFVVTIILSYSVGISNHTMTRRDMGEEKPGEWIALFAVLIAFVLFVTGVFPIYPVAVATGSMEPTIMTGDMVIVNKTAKAKETLKVGDVIQYQRGEFTVIHRIIEEEHDHEERYFVTQGDNNSSPDTGEVTMDMVIGKIEFRVKYAGWLTLWMHSAKVEDDTQEVDVETGGHNIENTD